MQLFFSFLLLAKKKVSSWLQLKIKEGKKLDWNLEVEFEIRWMLFFFLFLFLPCGIFNTEILFFYLSVCSYAYLSFLFQKIYLFILKNAMSVCLSVCLPICSSFIMIKLRHWSVHWPYLFPESVEVWNLPAYISIYNLLIYPSVSLSICLCLSACLFVDLSFVCLSGSLFAFLSFCLVYLSLSF